jgi:hypothetical protein
VNYLFRPPFFGWSRMDSAKLGDYVAKNVGVVDLHEIAAGKMWPWWPGARGRRSEKVVRPHPWPSSNMPFFTTDSSLLFRSFKSYL